MDEDSRKRKGMSSEAYRQCVADITWDDDNLYSLGDFLAVFSPTLPRIVRIAVGFTGMKDNTFCTNQIYFVYKIQLQKRFILRDEAADRSLSVPLASKVKFRIHDEQDSSSQADNKTLDEIVKSRELDGTPLKLSIESSNPDSYIEVKTLDMDTVLIQPKYLMLDMKNYVEEKYLVCLGLLHQGVYERPLSIPSYTPITLQLPKKLSGNANELLRRLQSYTGRLMERPADISDGIVVFYNDDPKASAHYERVLPKAFADNNQESNYTTGHIQGQDLFGKDHREVDSTNRSGKFVDRPLPPVPKKTISSSVTDQNIHSVAFNKQEKSEGATSSSPSQPNILQELKDKLQRRRQINGEDLNNLTAVVMPNMRLDQPQTLPMPGYQRTLSEVAPSDLRQADGSCTRRGSLPESSLHNSSFTNNHNFSPTYPDSRSINSTSNTQLTPQQISGLTINIVDSRKRNLDPPLSLQGQGGPHHHVSTRSPLYAFPVQANSAAASSSSVSNNGQHSSRSAAGLMSRNSPLTSGLQHTASQQPPSVVHVSHSPDGLSVNEVVQMAKGLSLSEPATARLKYEKIDGSLLCDLVEEGLLQSTLHLDKLDVLKITKAVREGWRPKDI